MATCQSKQESFAKPFLADLPIRLTGIRTILSFSIREVAAYEKERASLIKQGDQVICFSHHTAQGLRVVIYYATVCGVFE